MPANQLQFCFVLPTDETLETDQRENLNGTKSALSVRVTRLFDDHQLQNATKPCVRDQT